MATHHDEFAFVFYLLAEGVPDEEIVERVRERALRDNTFLRRLRVHVAVYRDNLTESAEIPADVADEDGEYRKQRLFAKETLPRLNRLIQRLGLSED